MKVMVSTSLYALGHEMGMMAALEEFRRQLGKPDRDSLPEVRMITRIRDCVDIQLHVDTGATYIHMMRSRAFHEAWSSDCDAWISLDDDVEATLPTVEAMIDLIGELPPRVGIVPYLLRVAEGYESRPCCVLPTVRAERPCKGGKLLTMPRGAGGGFGFVGMNRAAMREIVEANNGGALLWIDQDEREKLAIFREFLEEGLWWGEDTSFFRRVPPSVSVELLLVGTSLHAGVPLQLQTL